MKIVSVYIIHHVDRGQDDRAYVSTFEPPISRVEELRAKGYEVYRANVVLPIDDKIRDVESTVVRTLHELGGCAGDPP